MTEATAFELDQIFGEDSCGDTPEERARSSNRLFIRSQHQLSRAVANSSGRRFSASETYLAYGWDTLRELLDHSAVPLVAKGHDPLKRLKDHIRNLGVGEDEALARAHWPEASVAAFKADRQVPFIHLERLAQMLALEPHQLGQTTNRGEAELGVRLRQMRQSQSRFTAATVLLLAEASWVVQKQIELSRLLEKPATSAVFEPSDDYGSFFSPAWRKGQDLALETRDRLGLGADTPIESMTRLLEDMGIPVIHLELPDEFAGATISSGDARGIVINVQGKNHSVWVRRMTMAHELGHLLWDPPARLQRLVVDSYEDLETGYKTRDPVEQRANAFAVEFLLPKAAIPSDLADERNHTAGIIHLMETFGVGRAAATYHTENTLHIQVRTDHIALDPDDSLIAREELLVSYPAFEPVRMSRRGRFAFLVQEAVEKNLLSTDTAAAYLGCTTGEIDDILLFLKNMNAPAFA